jgi:hypothetical protein
LEIKFEKLLKGEELSEDEAPYASLVESYLSKVQYLESEVH